MSRRVRALLPGLAAVVLFCLPLLPEILGTRRLVFRDAQITHWPWRRAAMESLRSGRVPFVNGSASGGQPLLANPNAALLYPTLLLEKLLPAASAFNLHYLLHLLWALWGARALARRLGLSDGPAFLSGVVFAFSGMMISYTSAFLNSGAAAAWLPWCAAASLDLVRARSRRRALRAGAAASLAFGLQLLAGEPALSLLTVFWAAFLAISEVFVRREGAGPRARNLLAGGIGAGILAVALAAPLLLPLGAVFPLSYRGQHLFSERAFAASPFAPWRVLEWFFPRFNGDPGALAAGAHWQYGLHAGDTIYIWCVTFGVISLLAILAAGMRKDFWDRASAWLAAGAFLSLLFSLGSSLPLYRLLFLLPPLRRLRYPIKFYLVTTLCVALLAGLAAERLSKRRCGRREAILLFAAVGLYAAALALSHPGGFLDRTVEPLLSGLAVAPAALLPAIRESFRGDALFGLAAVAALGVFLFARAPLRGQSHLLGLAILALALPWGLPLFVSAAEKDLERLPEVLSKLRGSGLVYVSPSLPEFNVLLTGTAHPKMRPLVADLARVQIEELIPSTGAPFGVRYLFDADPDGSYGYYNRLAGETLAASSPLQKSRLLRAYGARWALDDEGPSRPLWRSLTGLEIAGRRLVLSELPDPVPELRFVGREHRRTSLSGALELIRSEDFRPETDVVLPGRENRNASGGVAPARVSVEELGPDRASARVEAAAAGHLIFSRTYFRAWRAHLDGREAPVLVANARDLAVAVGPGQHRVTFQYDRMPLCRGVALQAAAFAALLLAALGARSPGADVREPTPRHP
ncbi:MAG: hypothetical protein ACRD1P_10985 [Thermoanaerobaculia bacterium]